MVRKINGHKGHCGNSERVESDNASFSASRKESSSARASQWSELNALRGVQPAANQALADGRLVAGPNGILPGNGLGAVLNVNGVNVQLIGGRVMNGVVELGSFVGL
jgi:hypothetical protein